MSSSCAQSTGMVITPRSVLSSQFIGVVLRPLVQHEDGGAAPHTSARFAGTLTPLVLYHCQALSR